MESARDHVGLSSELKVLKVRAPTAQAPYGCVGCIFFAPTAVRAIGCISPRLRRRDRLPDGRVTLSHSSTKLKRVIFSQVGEAVPLVYRPRGVGCTTTTPASNVQCPPLSQSHPLSPPVNCAPHFRNGPESDSRLNNQLTALHKPKYNKPLLPKLYRVRANLRPAP